MKNEGTTDRSKAWKYLYHGKRGKKGERKHEEKKKVAYSQLKGTAKKLGRVGNLFMRKISVRILV